MPIFVMFIIVSLVFYVFYRVKAYRSKLPAEKKWISSKASIALGLFVGIFGLNQLFLNPSTVTYIVSAVFILIGGISVWGGIKSYQFYLPHAAKEAEQLYKK
ncbi:YtpI family protein [Cytobacillus sp. FJAT-54145]|uniref:YtpI family protein n=1 Tax=Cytobacillus spartinae TaxID=3299023 RepID=A0ABW6KHT5_9BACI